MDPPAATVTADGTETVGTSATLSWSRVALATISLKLLPAASLLRCRVAVIGPSLSLVRLAVFADNAPFTIVTTTEPLRISPLARSMNERSIRETPHGTLHHRSGQGLRERQA